MNRLIGKSLEISVLDYILQIPPTMQTKQEIKWISWIRNYFNDFGSPPTIERFCNEFTDFVFVESKDPIADVFAMEIGLRRNTIMREWVIANTEELKDGKDPYNKLVEVIGKLQVPSRQVVSAENYDVSRFFDSVTMYKTGFKSLDENSGGIGKGDLVYIFGRPGSGKTTLLLSMIVKWILDGTNVVVISNEIRYEDIVFKLYAQMVGVDISAKRRNALTEIDKKKLLVAKHFLQINKNLRVVKGAISDVSQVSNFIDEKTEILAIDGAYLMSKSPDWKDLTSVSNTLRTISNNAGIAIVGVIQANRGATEKTGLDNVAGSDSFTQDADIILGVNPAGLITGGRSVNILSSKNRHGVPVQFSLNVTLPIVNMWEG